MPKLLLRQTLAVNLRTHRTEFGLAQTEVATRAKQAGHEIDQKTVSRAERGENVTLDAVDALAVGLGINPLDLLEPTPGTPEETARHAFTQNATKLDEVLAVLTPEKRAELMKSYAAALLQAANAPDSRLSEQWMRPDRRRKKA